MNPRFKYLAGSALALSLVAGAAVLHSDNEVTSDDATATSLAGISAGMHFTDEKGKARRPSAAEHAALAEAFQADIAKLTKGKRIPVGEKRHRDGSYSAVVGTDKMQFLTVSFDDEGNASFGHSTMDDEGRVEPAPANDWPEM